MSSEADLDYVDQSDGTSLNQGIKRSSDSLFVGYDEEDDKGDYQVGNKRIKTEHLTNVEIFSKLTLDKSGKVIPYDAFKYEGRPHLAIYHSSFTEVEKLVRKVCTDFESIVKELKDSGYQNEEINNICEHDLRALREPRNKYPSVPPTSCLGPAGVGKSSSMNCFLDQSGAAPESDSAQRGTSLVHIFCHPSKKQTALFQVSATYSRDSQIESLLQKHCRNIFACLEQGGNSDEDDEDDGDEPQKKFNTALDFFRTLLCDLDGFKNDDDAREYFESRQDDDEDEVVKELKGYIITFKKTRPLKDGIEYHEAENYKELADRFRLVSRPPKVARGQTQKPHLDKDLLNAGLELADTPGVNDSNQAVVDATTNQLRRSGTILVFASIKRIAENDSLDANLRECIRLGKMRDTFLIVTMIDNLQEMKDEDRADLSEDDRYALEKAEQTVSELMVRERTLKQNKAAAFKKSIATPVEFEELKKLEEDLDEMPQLIARAEASVKQVTIEIRTAEVAEELKGKFRKLERSKHAPDLPIFMVSNSQYQKHLLGYDPKHPPILSVEATGIPSVRRMLYEIPTRGKSNTLFRFGRNRLPSIFNSITGILTKSPLERKQDVEKVIATQLSGYGRIVEILSADLKESYVARVVKLIGGHADRWKDKAEKLLREWEKYNGGTFTAFCRRSGHWRPKKKEAMISWNAKIQAIFEAKLAAGFEALEDDILDVERNAATNVADLFKTLETALEECEDFQGVKGAQLFFEVIRHTRDSATIAISKIFIQLRVDIEAIRHAAMLDAEDSYVATAMQKTYEQCLAISNPNHQPGVGRKKVHKKSSAHLRRVECIRQKLQGMGDEPSVFATVSSSISAAFEELLGRMKEKGFVPALQGAHDHILKDFDRRFNVPEEAKVEANLEAVERLKSGTAAALAIIEGPMKDHIERCEEYEKSGR
ncbi:hypothetical protein LTR37_004184 [Vermiconidia calcicola]|uniref:Uncharacterized protein n=1 Tax=Vermiconidia calcicola TaxID=1690605 RepID=A0ACC3NMY6_9PEZI|nr:hypothetical protein LTR37_004184 [Vermiconidia calcicola]